MFGWKNYFGYCQTPSLLQQLDQWLGHRLRSMIWKQWKHGQQRYGKLRQLGVGKDLAAQTAGNPHGVWQTVRPCPSRFRLSTSTLSDFIGCLLALRNPLNRPMRTRMSGGVAGAGGRSPCADFCGGLFEQERAQPCSAPTKMRKATVSAARSALDSAGRNRRDEGRSRAT
jgi:hypothetical protein